MNIHKFVHVNNLEYFTKNILSIKLFVIRKFGSWFVFQQSHCFQSFNNGTVKNFLQKHQK